MYKFGLDKKTIEIIINLFESFTEIEKVLIFGSRAKGSFRNSSDIDFALLGNISDKLCRHIASGLDELPTPYKFDVVNYNTLDTPELIKSIDDFGKIFYERK